MDYDLEKAVLETQSSLKKNVVYMISFFLWGLVLIIIFLIFAPELPTVNNSVFLTFPYPLEKLQKVSEAIKVYHDQAYIYTLLFFASIYIILQSLAIPGPICLSFMAGSIFGRWKGLIIVTICATLGSSFCYFLYQTYGKGIVVRLFPGFIKKLNEKVLSNREKLFNCLLLLRVLPIIPNWIINFSSPIIGIPFSKFALATFFGLIIPNAIQISAGMAINDLNKGPDYISMAAIGLIVLMAGIPMIIEKKNKVKL